MCVVSGCTAPQEVHVGNSVGQAVQLIVVTETKKQHSYGVLPPNLKKMVQLDETLTEIAEIKYTYAHKVCRILSRERGPAAFTIRPGRWGHWEVDLRPC